ncbi:unnamed protein product [Adineta steineri]|uniref:Jacalin-type lectin domain-containing protein n=2 Tax=Adineta steineri TaxID=433720 RepID=A0A819FWA4_9BILA|nr:unnamed protein product [Adineta steineri]
MTDKLAGGSGGIPFNDAELLDSSKIYAPQTISMTQGTYSSVLVVGMIQITYAADDGTSFAAPKHGNLGEASNTTTCGSFNLQPDEKIIQVNGRYSARINSLQFVTTKNRKVPDPACGGTDGAMFTDSKLGYYLSFISGRSGVTLDAIQFHWVKFLGMTYN